MMRICLLVCALALGGCMGGGPVIVTHHYTLGASAASGAPSATPATAAILKVTRIEVPPWLAGSAMYYRLAYAHDGRLATYGHSDWIAPPATLLEPLVQHALAASGHWRAVVGPDNPALADLSVHLKLEDFSQSFAQADRSTGVLEATATLLDNHDESVVRQKHFRIEVAAPTPDAQGGASALNAASRQLATRIAAWLSSDQRG